MAKAILVMDMPECCKECGMIYEVRDTGVYYCYKTTSCLGTDKDILSKDDWCPLIKLPDRNPDREVLFSGKSFTMEDINDAFKLGEDTGWNAFIDYLEGKT